MTTPPTFTINKDEKVIKRDCDITTTFHHIYQIITKMKQGEKTEITIWRNEK